jgi:hypothetical protein
MKDWTSKLMHDNHNLDLLSDWDLSQLLEDDQDDDQEPQQNENSGEMVW